VASIYVHRMDSMGSDLTVANAARVSFDKHKDELDDSDEKLIAFLAKHGHWSPFSHVSIQFKIDAPIFVARQLQKHQVGLAWNEVSRRYVDTEPEFYSPIEWRRRAADKKQGSMSEPIASQSIANGIMKEAYDASLKAYSRLLRLTATPRHTIEPTEIGTYNLYPYEEICPEQARMVLPQSTMTSWYWSGSLYAFSRVCNLRLKEDAQAETREVAQSISNHCAIQFPISWKHLIQG
jgi:thymidylate synthase (FAD)